MDQKLQDFVALVKRSATPPPQRRPLRRARISLISWPEFVWPPLPRPGRAARLGLMAAVTVAGAGAVLWLAWPVESPGPAPVAGRPAASRPEVTAAIPPAVIPPAPISPAPAPVVPPPAEPEP